MPPLFVDGHLCSNTEERGHAHLPYLEVLTPLFEGVTQSFQVI